MVPLAAAILLATVAWIAATRNASIPQTQTAKLVARGSYPRESALSPDGNDLAFLDIASALTIRELETAQDHTLTPQEERGAGLAGTPPIWSPDGRRLAYVTMERDLGNAGPPGWSPDGKHVIFVVHGIGRGSHNCLMSLSVSGGEEPRLFYRPKSTHPIPWKPYWSSDGSTIFFTGFMREYQVWMMNGFLSSF